MKTEALNSCAVTRQLHCCSVPLFSHIYAKSMFSHDAAHIRVSYTYKCTCIMYVTNFSVLYTFVAVALGP